MMTASEFTLHSTLKRCVDEMSKENAQIRKGLQASRQRVSLLEDEVKKLRDENEALKGKSRTGEADPLTGRPIITVTISSENLISMIKGYGGSL